MFTILINYFRRHGAAEAAAAEGDISVILQPVDDEAAVAEIVFEHPEWGDDVLRSKKTGAVINPMEMDKVIATLLAAICSIGIVLNLEIVLRIAKDKALRKKPRYVIQLAIAVSAICTLIENLILVVQYVVPGSKKNNHQQQEDLICLFFIAVVGLSYDSMLLNRLLSLVDCFAAIAYPFWHRRKVTTRRVTYWLIGLNLLALPLIIKSPFIAGYLQLYCAVQESHLIAIQLPMAVLFTLCFVFYCVDFAIAWQLLPRPSSGSRAAVPSTMPSNNRLSLPKGCRGGLRRKKAMKKKKKENSIEMACSNLNPPAAAAADSAPAASASYSQSAMNNPQQQQRHESSSPQQQQSSLMSIRHHRHRRHASAADAAAATAAAAAVRKRELKAAKKFLLGVLPLFLLPFPLLLFAFFYNKFCIQFISPSSSSNASNSQVVCDDLTWLVPYLFRIFKGLHALVDPIMSLWLNKDFAKKPCHLLSVLITTCCCCCCCCNKQQL